VQLGKEGVVIVADEWVGLSALEGVRERSALLRLD
jgi:hypothetical protein